ncbi:Hypothetical predicted protein [Lecanosticta acicola]|uniref:ceramidase n=1 Tax=Lecanosticta acicola TaxID=111012 RepID=A0AAI9E9H8_9PEZI|nr:Hypothetical predicted protein [Lecanosticta acicola]
MPPATRSQTMRETVATSTAPAQDLLAHEHNVRLRRQTSESASVNRSQTSISRNAPDEPPRFTIDLSLPPEQRYLEVCAAFREQIHGLTPLFDEVVGDIVRFLPLKWLKRLSKTLLRKVYDSEESRELQGISKATGVEMYLLVCFNVLLDLFMGCSSGGAAVREEEGEGSKMLHFRTLDWGMPSLRQVVVQLDFTMEASGPIVASSITYAGYVGVLTGVRKDFSLSLNFRPSRNDKFKFWADLRYYWHLLMVLLGKRRSISSELRRFLLPTCSSRAWLSSKSTEKSAGNVLPYHDVVKEVSGQGGKPLTTTACYLCFSDGNETTVMEKDRVSAVVRSNDEFIAITNNDIDREDEAAMKQEESTNSTFAMALAEIVDEAKDRRQCAEHNYHNLRAKKAKRSKMTADPKRILEVDDIVEMVQKYPTTNETTHFACVMDPKLGIVRWCRRWKKPVTAKWIREHQSETW